jgi:clan AA aspartic protease (TIGR02281 family)
MRSVSDTCVPSAACVAGASGRRRVASLTGPRTLLAAAAVGLAIQSAPAEAAPTKCMMVKIAEWPLRLARSKLIVEGAINGQPVNVMLDTGATATLIPRPAAQRLGLSRQKASGYRMFGVGGETDVESALVDELRIGDAVAKSRRVMVAGEHEVGDGVAVILGEDFLHSVDVEFDLAHSAVRLFQPKDCDGTPLAYWAADGASEVPIERVGEVRPSIVLTVQINGQPVRALLDSGAGASVLDRPEAARLGITDASDSAGRASGLGQQPVDWRVGAVNSFVIGGEAIKDTTLHVADWSKGMRYSGGSLVPQKFEGSTTMLLGVDFLRAHRVLVAHSQQKLYFTYVGGPVFEGRDPASDRDDPDRAVADYDAAIRSDPRNAAAYFHRGNAWYAKKEYGRAIADYDLSIRIEPGRASALANRGMAKQHTGDLDGAIADWTRAIEIDPGLALAYNQLAWVLATAERPAVRDGRRAVESALKACDLTQWKNPRFIDTLAAAYARAGNFEEAVKWQRKAMEKPRSANDSEAAQRLRLYEESKPWPAD